MEKSTRPVRNRRHSRRAWPPGDTHRPVKRLFTPEIKRMLKDWLVRRRDNPYPSRDEKKVLAYETGLTYTQICNWFANWRRKLKNSGKEPAKKTWGHLIKNYNTNAKGNVEQFSICSSDSIWGDAERSSERSSLSPLGDYPGNYLDPPGGEQLRDCDILINNNNNNTHAYISNHEICDRNGAHEYFMNSMDYYKNIRPFDHCYTPIIKNAHNAQCFQISSTTEEQQNYERNLNETFLKSQLQQQPYQQQQQQQTFSSNTKYKQQMMEKYLRDTNTKSSSSSSSSSSSPSNSSPELSKWLESAANFTPHKNNYIEWNIHRSTKSDKRRNKTPDGSNIFENCIHQKEELDAAEALANLACNYRQRLMNSTPNLSVA